MGEMFFIQQDDGTPRRTKITHPYSYDPIVQFVNNKHQPTGCCYSDRLFGWYGHDRVRSLMKKHFNEDGDYWGQRSAEKVRDFLREILDKPELEMCLIEEHCNQATGYPVWYFAYSEPQASQPQKG